jgi:redox-sensing transcriptional repressor
VKPQGKIPDPAIRRLSLYHSYLASLMGLGVATISSREIAAIHGLTPFQVRKDLSYLGSFGRRGRGYSVPRLKKQLSKTLGLNRTWKMVLIGAGNVGLALLRYSEFRKQGFEIAAVFDADPRKIGQQVDHDMTIRSLDELAAAVKALQVRIGIVAVPPDTAQRAVDQLIRSGIKAILCFPRGQYQAPEDVCLRQVNLEQDLEFLSYNLANRIPGKRNRAVPGVS